VPPVDLKRLRADLDALDMGDLVDELIESFLGEALIWPSGLQTALEAGDSTRIRSAAHAYRSVAKNLRAHGLTNVLEAIESSARDGDASTGSEPRAGLVAEHERAIPQLEAERGDPQAPWTTSR
jgi:HPt (histidine-containing phosphotransfer) domain-containing protein